MNLILMTMNKQLRDLGKGFLSVLLFDYINQPTIFNCKL